MSTTARKKLLPLSGYVVGVLWPAEDRVAREEKLIRFGADILHLYPKNDAEISKQDFVTWWDAKAKEIHAAGSTLFVLLLMTISIPNGDIITWLAEKEENDRMGNGSNEHLHVRFVKWSKLVKAVKGEPLIDSWGDVLEKRKIE
jgi:hypothetical protein